MSGWDTSIRRLVIVVLVIGMAAAGVEAQEDRFFPNTTKLGRAAVKYKDQDIHVVAAYYYSQREHDSRWLLIEAAMSTTRNLTIERSNITLVTPGGRAVTLASQERFSADVNRARRLVQSASVLRHNVVSYFSQRSYAEAIRLFALPGGTVLTNFVTDQYHVAVGDLFFESPTGLWQPGTYSLVIEKEGARAALPIELE